MSFSTSPLFSIFRVPSKPKSCEKRRKDVRTRTVRHTSNGNILLQLGRFVTVSDVEKKKSKLRHL